MPTITALNSTGNRGGQEILGQLGREFADIVGADGGQQGGQGAEHGVDQAGGVGAKQHAQEVLPGSSRCSAPAPPGR